VKGYIPLATFWTHEVLVCRKDENGSPIIKSKGELQGKKVAVRKSSSYFRSIKKLWKEAGKKFSIVEIPETLETEEILNQVQKGEYDATVADDYIAKTELRYQDQLVISFPITERQPLGWAIRKNALHLLAQVDSFFTSGDYKPKGLKYNILYNRYFKKKKKVYDSTEERLKKKGTLSPWDDLLKKYGKRYDHDWRMLASQMYQESRFDPDAKSWVGAVGLMQIMPGTAAELKVGDVRKPEPSIHGGAKYMRKQIDRLNKRIAFRDQFHFALAAYNAGYGHVLDARRIAEEKGWDPLQWFNHVEKGMLLLAKPAYASKARYGYCRGAEPVQYIRKIQERYNRYVQQIR